jgi:hypothetical protein
MLTLVDVESLLSKDLDESDFLLFVFKFAQSICDSAEKRILCAMIPSTSSCSEISICSILDQVFDNIDVISLVFFEVAMNSCIECSVSVSEYQPLVSVYLT